jgi:uncharacterized protein YbjT (DUF2867 family)
MILVAGATGNAGGATVRGLLDAGAEVRALVRDPAAAELPSDVQVVAGDLNRPDSLHEAIAGAEAAFLLSGYDGLEETLAEMKRAGLKRAVLLSSSAAPGGDLSNAVARYHILSEQAVRDSGLGWTFLRPNSFMSNTMRWADQLRAGDTVRLPFADVAVATIDPDDLGAVAAAALTSDAHEGQALRLSGPESLRPADQVAVVGGVLGRELRFEAMTDDEARAEMSENMPAEYVDAFMSFFVEGTIDESEVLPTVEQVLGRPPGTYERWVRANAAALQ